MILRFIRTVICLIDDLSELIGKSVAWLTVVMVFVMGLIVGLRYLMDLGWIAMQESVTYFHTLVFMLGAAYTLKIDGHVRVDIIYQRCGRITRAWIDLLGALFLLGPVCIFIIWSSWDYVTASWSVREASGEAGGLPGLYLLKTLIPVMSGCLLLQGLSQALSSLVVILDPKGFCPRGSK